MPALAPPLFQQPNAGHGHAFVHGLAHVVDGEQGDLQESYKSTTYADQTNESLQNLRVD